MFYVNFYVIYVTRSCFPSLTTWKLLAEAESGALLDPREPKSVAAERGRLDICRLVSGVRFVRALRFQAALANRKIKAKN